ncbi:PREDICTED: uncharacterized protein LOC109580953 [Amphimedon queenslandica]|uniref:Death domain-containing protein n=1 Tax=Amphimedon queenslandica TaxID=400682 RepID=A0A1X7VAD0_AMPQE|nr:PREDICTED: uncharacterized protein LOC109580953 [Amphimedon queenslandica]|eukprot:XP_019850152.1 PREDICTED: uncharacterized protein LOC109580953 [Amphimedon queenslandica]
MPCALKPADVEREERDGSVSPAPLLICFECGYTPVGVFCCLVVYLLDQKTDRALEWKLTGNDQYRNRITFQVGQYYDTVTLISRATYLEVWVQQMKGSELSTSDLLSSLHKGLVTVTQSLHYTYKSKHMFGISCTCTAVPHPAVIGLNKKATMCLNGRIVEFNEKQLYWSSKVVQLNNATQNASSEIPSQAESHIPKSSLSHGTAPVDIEVCPRDLFLHHSADITQCISFDVTDDDTQSSSNTSNVLGLKRHSEDEASESALTNIKQRLLSDDVDDPPSPLNKGYGKKSTENKPHRIKTGQPSDELGKRKQNEDHDGSSRSKRFKVSGNNDTTAETTIKWESSLSHNADLLLEIKPQKSDLLRLFQSSDAHYMIIGTALNVKVDDLLPNPQSTTSNLIQVFQRWIDSDDDVTWRNILQVCGDYPDKFGKAKSDVQQFLSSDRARIKYLK